jgi:outer membrane protein
MTRLGLVMPTLLAAGLALGSPTAAQGQQQGGMKIAYVVGQAILNQTPGYAAADSIWQVEVAGYRREVDQLQAKLDSAAAKFAEQSVMLSPTNRTAQQKVLQAQQDSLDKRQSQLQQKAIDRQQELLQPIQDRINAVIEGVRAEGNYAMIFDVSAQGHGILAADKSLDLTQMVIDRLKKGSAGGTPH